MLHDLAQRFHAWALIHSPPRYEESLLQRKSALLREIRGTILELGPGAGPNFRYYPAGTEWLGLETNSHLHNTLRRGWEQRGINGRLLDGSVEDIPLPDASVDAVVSTFVLCTVPDVTRVLHEVRRVLRPEGRFFFFEHVAAPQGSVLHGMQRLARPVWKVLANGCSPDRNTEGILRSAGFSSVTAERFVMRVPLVAPHITGIAVK